MTTSPTSVALVPPVITAVLVPLIDGVPVTFAVFEVQSADGVQADPGVGGDPPPVGSIEA